VIHCPLCRGTERTPLPGPEGSLWHRCGTCHLTFRDPDERLPLEAERARYATHRNSPEDLGYQAFLSRLMDPLIPLLSPAAEGLDFGCGPGPTLSLMLEERGFPMAIYDPFFAPDETALHRSYDFITASEVVEHLFDPWATFATLDRLLRPGGILALMTERTSERTDLATWWYARDPTHVALFHEASFRWMAEALRWTVTFPATTVALLRKPSSGGAAGSTLAPTPDLPLP